MNERKPVKSLFDLKLTTWFVTRKPIIQEAICKYPPGYYIYKVTSVLYRLIGWSEPDEKLGETEVYIFLEREIEGGTERIRIHPDYIAPEEQTNEEQTIIEAVEEVETVTNFEPVLVGYNIGKEFSGEIKYLSFEGQRRIFYTVEDSKNFLMDNGYATNTDQLEEFVYSPVYS